MAAVPISRLHQSILIRTIALGDSPHESRQLQVSCSRRLGADLVVNHNGHRLNAVEHTECIGHFCSIAIDLNRCKNRTGEDEDKPKPIIVRHLSDHFSSCFDHPFRIYGAIHFDRVPQFVLRIGCKIKAGDNAEVGPPSFQCPVEITMLCRTGLNDAGIRKNHLKHLNMVAPKSPMV